MSEVVMHPRAAEGRARQAAREIESAGILDKQRTFFEERIRTRVLVRHAYARMDERPLMHRSEERRRVGENLWLLLEDIEKGPHGVSKARVLQKAIHANRIDSTKHLARYAFRPSPNPHEAEHRSRYLLKKVVKFVHIAKIAAELGGLDPEITMLRILEGTWYTQDVPEDPLAEDRERRTAELTVILADIEERLCAKYRLGAAIQRMEDAGWTLRVPGDLTSPMRVDPTLLGKSLGLDKSDLSPAVQWNQIERYPFVHLGYVDFFGNPEVGRLIFPKVGHVLGQFHFEYRDGDIFDTETKHIPVYFRSLYRIDIVLSPTTHDWSPKLRFAISPVTWFKPTEELRWQSTSGVEFGIPPDETLGEIEAEISLSRPRPPPPLPPLPPLPARPEEFAAAFAKLSSEDQATLRQTVDSPDLQTKSEFQAARQKLYDALVAQTTPTEPQVSAAPDATAVCKTEDLPHSMRLVQVESTHLTWADGSWNGSLVLVTDEDGKAVSSMREAELSSLIARMKECQPLSYRGLTLLWGDPPTPILDQPIRYRHFESDPSIAHLWTDERPNGTAYADHPLALIPVPTAEVLYPVAAPEGTLSARLERWIRGELENRSTLEKDLEEAVAAFMARVDTTVSNARDRLNAAVYGKR
jgi:hypothetical protein